MRYCRSILLPVLRLTPPTEGFPWDNLRKILKLVKVHSGEEILPKALTPCVGCTNVTDRQTTDRQICASKDPNVRVKTEEGNFTQFWFDMHLGS